MNGYPLQIPYPDDDITKNVRSEVSILLSHISRVDDGAVLYMPTLMSFCYMRGYMGAYDPEPVSMYLNYLIEVGIEDVDTILLAMHYMPMTGMGLFMEIFDEDSYSP